MKLKLTGIEFGRSWLKPEYRDVIDEPYYIYWFDIAKKPENRAWGKHYFWYDGPHKWYCFWYFNIGWSTPWTKWEKKEK